MQMVTTEAALIGPITPLGPFEFVVVRPPDPVNHILHLILSIFTAGLWLFVWLFLVIDARGEQRHVVSVDEAGGVWVDNKLRRHGLGI